MSSSGVAATIYDGPLAPRRTASGSYTFPAWNGRGPSGAYLPTGNYNYRIRLTKAGATGSASARLVVARNLFTMTTSNNTDHFIRYVYAGPTRLYFKGTTPDSVDDVSFTILGPEGRPVDFQSADTRIGASGPPMPTTRWDWDAWRNGNFWFEMRSTTGVATMTLTVMQ
jgi:hypothetical protein